MRRLLQEPVLNSSIDFDGHDLLNVDQMLPVPLNLVDVDDARLDDQRTPVAGSVTDAKVSSTAAIDQSKLNLNGNIPTGWLGVSDKKAAQGNLVQLRAGRNAASGYPGLDSNGRVALGQMPFTGPASGTVNDVKLALPPEFDVTIPEVKTSGTLTAAWKGAADNTWFGASGPSGFGPAGIPTHQAKLIPDSIMPDLDASKITTGLIDLERFPVMKPFGLGHAAGILPDPGLNGDPSDYLARDGSYKPVVVNINYQPTLPPVQIILQYYQNGTASIRLFCPRAGSKIFYHIQDIGASPVLTAYVEASLNPMTLMVHPNFTVYAYAAKAGYNNSGITNFTVPNPPNA